MKAIRVYHNRKCQRCSRMSRFLHRMDWRNRVEISTEVPATGPLRPGEIVVEKLATGQICKGHQAFALLCRHIPLYAPAAILLISRQSRNWLDRELGGCAAE